MINSLAHFHHFVANTREYSKRFQPDTGDSITQIKSNGMQYEAKVSGNFRHCNCCKLRQ